MSSLSCCVFSCVTSALCSSLNKNCTFIDHAERVHDDLVIMMLWPLLYFLARFLSEGFLVFAL